ncbi:MAG: hypothetical protein AABX10_01005 [Nanoarchaeota archaeon]
MPDSDLEYKSKACIDDVLRRYENGCFVLIESKGRVYSGVKQDVTVLDDVVLGWIVRVIPPLDPDLAKYIECNENVRRYKVEDSLEFRYSNHAYVSLHDGMFKKLTDRQSAHLLRHLSF